LYLSVFIFIKLKAEKFKEIYRGNQKTGLKTVKRLF